MAYATVADVEARLGRSLDTDETALVTARLGDAEVLIKARIPDLDAQIVAGTISEALVVMVEANMVLRVLRNPEGYTQETDGNYSYTISGRVSSGVLEVLPDEWSLLGVRASVHVIKPTFLYPWLSQSDEETSF